MNVLIFTKNHYPSRSLGYRDDMERKPSHMEMVTVQATAGMVAGACSSILTTPIDTVKTRLQVNEIMRMHIFSFHCSNYSMIQWRKNIFWLMLGHVSLFLLL